jgi:DNA-binding SARP family transcriptional activator
MDQPSQETPNPALRFVVLGPMRAWRGATELDLGPVRQQAVLAALVLRPDVTVSHHELVTGVWGSEPPGSGDTLLVSYVARLRRLLRPLGPNTVDVPIHGTPGGYRFVREGVWIDTHQLEQITAGASAAEEAGDIPAAVDAYARASALFQGEPLAGIPGPFAEEQRQRYTDRRVDLTLRIAELRLELGQSGNVVSELTELAAAYPLHESIAGLLIRALDASGRSAEALSSYISFRARLRDELGLDPSSELQRLRNQILHQGNTDRRLVAVTGGADEAAGDASNRPPARPAAVPVTIYLTDEAAHQRVEAAVEDFLAAAGAKVEHRDEPILGSWFRRMRTKIAETADSPLGHEALISAAHAADTRLVHAQDAAVTADLLHHLGPVISSLDATKEAVIRVGALLIVKVDDRVAVHQLTAAQQLQLDHHPALATSPNEILAALRLAPVNQRQPEADPDLPVPPRAIDL